MTAALIALAAFGFVVTGFFAVKARTASAALRDERAVRSASEAERDDARRRLRALEKYAVIADAEVEAARLLAVAREQAAAMVAEAEHERERAATEVAALREHAERALQDAKARAARLVSEAAGEGERLVIAAHEEAKSISAEALALNARVEELSTTARALKNVIDGYGDTYIVPTHSVFDELAEQFGFDEAGQTLKAIRAKMRQMTKDKSGATCAYVEANRRDTAIAFVLDAFNGKVDSILSDIRDDNIGTLTQRIRDAAVIVNRNGEAFRDARVTDEYVDLRLSELKWAAAVLELKEREREEQRALRERIREEEKAQREYERAIKEAEKEEELAKKALEKARREFAKAGEAEKSELEAKLQELAEKLRVAEAKGQKALSMAQLTKAGHVYVISNIGSFGEEVVKIGLTRRLEPLDRIRELGDASVPFEFDVHTLIKSDDAPALEYELHKRFVRRQVNKVNPRKEFFRIAVADIQKEVQGLGIKAEWTLSAACKAYKETLAIEKALAERRLDEAEWVREQLQEEAAILRAPSADDEPEPSDATRRRETKPLR